EALQAEGCFKVARFVEKPNRETAQGFIDAGNFFWNSGMFLFRADAYLKELAQFQPAMAQSSEEAVSKGYRDLDFCRLDEAAFTACPSDSIDYAVMEHTRLAVVVPASIGWNDVGSWSALVDVLESDGNGNVTRGDVYTDNASNCLVRAEGRIVAA